MRISGSSLTPWNFLPIQITDLCVDPLNVRNSVLHVACLALALTGCALTAHARDPVTAQSIESFLRTGDPALTAEDTPGARELLTTNAALRASLTSWLQTQGTSELAVRAISIFKDLPTHDFVELIAIPISKNPWSPAAVMDVVATQLRDRRLPASELFPIIERIIPGSGKDSQRATYFALDAIPAVKPIGAEYQDFLAGYLNHRYPHAANRAVGILCARGVTSPRARAAVLTFLSQPVEGPVNDYMLSEHDTLEVLYNTHEELDRAELRLAQRIILARVNEMGFPSRELAPILQRTAETAPDPVVRLSAATAYLASSPDLDPSAVARIASQNVSGLFPRESYVERLMRANGYNTPLTGGPVEIKWDPARFHEVYGEKILEVIAAQAIARPVLENALIPLLSSTNISVRSAAIDLLRQFPKLQDPTARAALRAAFPTLSGFAKNAAREVMPEVEASATLPTENAPSGRRARPRSRAARTAVYAALLQDLVTEADSFSGLKPEEKSKIRDAFNRFIETKDVTALDPIEDFDWGTREPPEATPRRRRGAVNVTEIQPGPESPIPEILHSMPDFNKYLEDRMGKAALDQARAGAIDIEVFAGSFETLQRVRELPPETTIRVASPYASWGIEKYLDISVAPPKLYFVIPPIREYAQHYMAMLRQALGKTVPVTLSETDRAKLKRDTIAAAKELNRELPAYENVIMGYEYAWMDELKANPDWEIVRTQSAKVTRGQAEVHGTYVEIRHRRARKASARWGLTPLASGAERSDPRVVRKILIVGSDKTIWGEASRNIVQGLVENQREPNSIREVIFLGSAGAPGLRTTYGISTPSQFFDRSGKQIPIQNSILEGITAKEPVPIRNPQQDLMEVQYTAHGMSVSPAEQTREQVSSQYVDKGVHTVDVETSLIAEYLARWNSRHNETDRMEYRIPTPLPEPFGPQQTIDQWNVQPEGSVRLGTIHLLTDNPASRSHTYDSSQSLSQVDKQKKSNARKAILEEVMEHLSPMRLPRCVDLYLRPKFKPSAPIERPPRGQRPMYGPHTLFGGSFDW